VKSRVPGIKRTLEPLVSKIGPKMRPPMKRRKSWREPIQEMSLSLRWGRSSLP
jgi:hypothetical protein